jgi:hypothetical protein
MAAQHVNEASGMRLWIVCVVPEDTTSCLQGVDALPGVEALSSLSHPVLCLRKPHIRSSSSYIPTSAQNRPCPNRRPPYQRESCEYHC